MAEDSVVCPLVFVRFADDELIYSNRNDYFCEVTARFTELPLETVANGAGSGPHNEVHDARIWAQLFSLDLKILIRVGKDTSSFEFPGFVREKGTSSQPQSDTRP